MSNSFVNRVSAERRVLLVINEAMGYDKQLTGLSNAAIDAWVMQLGRKPNEDLVSCLKRLGELTKRLSDRSHETFHSLPEEIKCQFEDELIRLEQEAATLSYKG